MSSLIIEPTSSISIDIGCIYGLTITEDFKLSA